MVTFAASTPDPLPMENATAEADRVKQPALRLSEVIGALSYALDLTEGQPP